MLNLLFKIILIIVQIITSTNRKILLSISVWILLSFFFFERKSSLKYLNGGPMPRVICRRGYKCTPWKLAACHPNTVILWVFFSVLQSWHYTFLFNVRKKNFSKTSNLCWWHFNNTRSLDYKLWFYFHCRVVLYEELLWISIMALHNG